MNHKLIARAIRQKIAADVGLASCADGHCVVCPPTGMHTNGGCQYLKLRDIAAATAVIRALGALVTGLEDELAKALEAESKVRGEG